MQGLLHSRKKRVNSIVFIEEKLLYIHNVVKIDKYITQDYKICTGFCNSQNIILLMENLKSVIPYVGKQATFDS